VLFARGFRLSIKEMVWLEGLVDKLPSGDQIPGFVEQVRVLLDSKVSVADARFLLRGTDAETAHLEPRDDEIAETLGELRAALQKIRTEHQIDPIDTDGALLRKRVGELEGGAADRRRGWRGHGYQGVFGGPVQPAGRGEEAPPPGPR
jgi:hypothetical protein